MTTGVLVTVIWMGMAALFGLLIGSFLNVCVYRLPSRITIVQGHSFCPKCKHPLGPLDLVPVFSYLLLGRRCRYCHEPISPRYAQVELLTGIYFALAALTFQPGQYTLPDWLLNITQQNNAALGITTLLHASLILTACSALAFCGLLVWSLIIWDGHAVPSGTFIFIAVPALVRLAMQPERLFNHLLAMIMCCGAFLLALTFNLLPEASRQQRFQLGAGLSLIGLMAGIQAVQPVLAVFLVEIMLMALLASRSQKSDRDPAQRAEQLWRSLPLQLLFISSLLWLIF